MKKIVGTLMLILFLVASTACAGATSDVQNTTSSTTGESAQTAGETSSANTSAMAAATAVPAASAAEALAENSATHDETEDYLWEDTAATSITLGGDSISVEGIGAVVEGSRATITTAGTYKLSGTLNDGQVIVNTDDEEIVRLVLNGVTIHNSTSAPLYVSKAEKAMIVLAEGTQNTLSDGTSYVFENPEEDEPNAALFSKADLTLSGSGALTVNASYNDGIASKDGLVIAGGTITVNAADDGIRGKDYLVVKDGQVSITAQGDGLKSDNEEDAAKGYIAVEAGKLTVVSGGDAISAQTDISIRGGTFTITAGGGNQNFVDETASAKGLKAVTNLVIDGGNFTLDTADDALHTNGSLTINGGDFNLSSGDDGMHADAMLTINGGVIRIPQSYEGIESAVITINDGDIHVVASDDGINVAGGVDGSGMMGPGGAPGGRQRPGGGAPGVMPGQDTFNYTGSYYLYIHGGRIVVEAVGDGLDVNGAFEMTAGTVLVNGPTEQMNGALDYDGGFKLTGGILVAAGSAGMAQAPGAASSQASVLIYFSAALPGGTLVHIQNSAGEDVLTFAPSKSFQSIAFSSPQLVQGETYTVYTGGNSSGTAADSLYQGGSYTPGTQYASFTTSSVVTMVGSGGGPNRP